MEIETFFDKVDESAAWLKSRVNIEPRVAVVLSGGLQGFADGITDAVQISSSEIPHFPVASAEGHSGKLIFGKFKGIPIVVLAGRYHFYEGHSPRAIVFPYFVMAKLGVRILVATNAAGGISKSFKPGDIMMITDHINMMGFNPLVGIATKRKKDQFTDMTNAYDRELQGVARRAAKKLKLDLKEGVYVAGPGPSYETKAEISVFRKMGADAAGMSTIPEVIAANFLRMRALAFSCIANPAADLHKGNMTHAEVLEAMNAAAPRVIALLNEVVVELIKTNPKFETRHAVVE